MKFKKYIFNCFLLLVPILLWNIILTDYLPVAFSPVIFWKDIPDWVSFSENTLRIVIMVIPFIMILSIKSRKQKVGLTIYLIGTILYFLSWILLIIYPNSNWRKSVFGFMAPAYTPLIWLIGVGLIGSVSYFKIKHLTIIYILLSLLFISFHSLHTFIVFERF